MRSSVREVERQIAGIAHALGGQVEVMRERVADDLRLLVDLLRHEVAVVALVDQEGGGERLAARPLDRRCRSRRGSATPLRMQHGPVAVLEIGDAVGERRERDRVGAEIHLAVAVADGERRALARADQQVVLALEQEGERERAAQPRAAPPRPPRPATGRSSRSRG